MPDYHYDVHMTIPGSDATVHMIFFDSFEMTDESHLTKRDKDAAAVALQFLEDKLSKSTATWKLVFSHFPYVSASEHGPNPDLEALIKPILHKYRAAFYLNGHDHNLQHTTQTDLGYTLQHYIIGASNGVTNTWPNVGNVPKNCKRNFWYPVVGTASEKKGGFAVGELQPDQFKITYYNEDGDNLYEFTQPVDPLAVTTKQPDSGKSSDAPEDTPEPEASPSDEPSDEPESNPNPNPNTNNTVPPVADVESALMSFTSQTLPTWILLTLSLLFVLWIN